VLRSSLGALRKNSHMMLQQRSHFLSTQVVLLRFRNKGSAAIVGDTSSGRPRCETGRSGSIAPKNCQAPGENRRFPLRIVKIECRAPVKMPTHDSPTRRRDRNVPDFAPEGSVATTCMSEFVVALVFKSSL
jgi:hypothetical protein